MKFKGKKANVKSVGFRILQEDDGLDGLRGKDGFKRSQVVSPLFGSDVKDTFVVNDIATSSNSVDVRKNYDYARKTKKISESELIEKYGTKYYEFQMITSDTRRAVYGDDITIGNNKNAAKKNFDEEKEFGFIKKADDILDNQPNVENDEIKSFDFDQFKEVTPNNSVDIDMSFGEFKPRYDSGERNTYSKPTNEENLGFLNPKTESVVKPAPSIPDYVNINSSHEVSDFNGPMPRENDNKPLKSSFDMPKIVSPYKDYKLPPFNIFKKGSASDTTMPEWLEEKKEIINQTLVDFGVPGEVIRSVKGPTFSRYEVSLQAGVPVKKVSNLYDNLQMNLGAKSLRIQAPIPGKRTVGIEVPNDKAETVFFGDIITEEFVNDGKPLQVALGKDIDNQSIYTRIDKWPHGLIAGSTGSGKSVCMNTILISLLLKNKPDDVKLLLIDPKTVELMSYNDIPHLVTPVINDPQLASEALKWACEEMDRRYLYLNKSRVRNIADYNELALKDPAMQKLPYIVIVIDELADLMLTASADVEESIMRITAKARAAGIHLLVATQRPTTDIVKGTIKANIATRVAFHTVSPVDSVTILDEGGAEGLLGKGDMLIKEGDIPNRLQGAFLSDSEIDSVTDWIRSQAQPEYLFTHDDLKKKVASTNAGGVASNSETPEMLYNCALYFIEHGSCSINGLQGQFNLGFNRAQKIVTALEQMGVISEKNATKPREVLMTVSELNELFNEQ